jgi:energy-converting hydrogenase Eha subunit E
MSETLDLESRRVIRKVRFSTYGATLVGSIGTAVSPMLSDPLANLIVNLVPFWKSETGFLALATLLDLAFIALFIATGAVSGGYYARSRPEDLIPKVPE